MFETAVGYRIQEWEPQKFCEKCAQKLIDWYEFKEMCEKTQESLVPFRIKQEPQESETIDVKPDISSMQLPPTTTIKTEVMETDPLEQETLTNDKITKPLHSVSTFTFDAYIRSYSEEPLENAEPLGIFKIQVPTDKSGPLLTCFKQILWSAIKGHVIREIEFVPKKKDPVWNEKEHPVLRDLAKFVEFHVDHYTHSLKDARFHLKNWTRKQKIDLYIYPCTFAVKSKRDCEKVQVLLDESPPIITDCPFPHCPIIVNASELENHKKICSFNPSHNGIIFCCLSIGCTKSVCSKIELAQHYEKCPYKLLMERRKFNQMKADEIEKIPISLITSITFDTCPFSDCHSGRKSKSLGSKKRKTK